MPISMLLLAGGIVLLVFLGAMAYAIYRDAKSPDEPTDTDSTPDSKK